AVRSAALLGRHGAALLRRHSHRSKSWSNIPPPRNPEDEPLALFEEWSRRLLEIARGRLDPRTRLALDLRLRRSTLPEIAKRFGLSESTVPNKYTLTRITQAVQAEIRGLVLELAPSQQADLVAFLQNGGLPEEKSGDCCACPTTAWQTWSNEPRSA